AVVNKPRWDKRDKQAKTEFSQLHRKRSTTNASSFYSDCELEPISGELQPLGPTLNTTLQFIKLICCEKLVLKTAGVVAISEQTFSLNLASTRGACSWGCTDILLRRKRAAWIHGVGCVADDVRGVLFARSRYLRRSHPRTAPVRGQ
ncbi:hypothetical protein OS493_038658, partial [Desmophyllum pertusum]